MDRAHAPSKRGGPGALTEREAIIGFYGKRALNRANPWVDREQESSPHPRGGLDVEDLGAGAFCAGHLTRMDNMLFSNMTLNPHPQPLDAHFCATETAWERMLINAHFTLGLMIGISFNDRAADVTIEIPGMTEAPFPAQLLKNDSWSFSTAPSGRTKSWSMKQRHIGV